MKIVKKSIFFFCMRLDLNMLNKTQLKLQPVSHIFFIIQGGWEQGGLRMKKPGNEGSIGRGHEGWA